MSLLIESDQATGPGGAPSLSDAELIEYAQWWCALTPRQQLEQAQRD